MNLEAIYFISQVIAAVALVGSLVFVGIQIRQYSDTRRNEARLNREAAIVAGLDSLSEHETGELWRRCSAGMPDVTDSELSRFLYAVGSLLVSTRARFHEHKQGLLNDDEWRAHKGNIDYILTSPGFRAAFILNRDAAFPDPEFYAQFDDALAQPPDRSHEEAIAQLRELTAKFVRETDNQSKDTTENSEESDLAEVNQKDPTE